MASREYQEQSYHKQLTELLAKFYYKKIALDTTELIKQIQVLEQFSMDSKRILCLFSNVDFYFKYVSENVKQEMGYSSKEIYDGGLPLAFKMVYWKQFSIAIKVHQWGERFQAIIKDLENTSQRNAFFCGVKMKDKEGKLKTFFIKQKILSVTKNNKPLLSFMEIEEITTIFKGDFVWSRMTAHYEQETYVRAFFSKGTKKEYADLLSGREMEILRLIVQHKNNIEISELLDISKNTVERHRKNMIARAGVIDMTALIYVCRLCQLL